MGEGDVDVDTGIPKNISYSLSPYIFPNDYMGFTLIEVLVALVIFTVGLLGFVDAQLVAMRQNQQIVITAFNLNQQNNSAEQLYAENNNFKGHQGFSLLEMLLSIALSISLILIISYCYTAAHRIYQVNVNMLSMQNTAYAAEQILAHDIRTAGLVGCSRLTTELIVQHPANINITPSNKLIGYTSDQLPADVKSIANSIAPNSDLLVIEKMSDNLTPLFSIRKHSAYNVNELIMVADCDKATIITYSVANMQAILNKNNFSRLAQVAPLEKNVFYISNTGRKTANGQPIFALYRKNGWGVNHEQTETVDGIENMQIRYGITSQQNHHINYVNATQVKDWSRVAVVKIYLLLTSNDTVNFNKQSYQFVGEKFNSPDHRLRREWVMITALREN